MKKDYQNYYEIIQPIGSNGFSTVYKAKVKGKEEYRAIKVINKEKIKSEYIKQDENEYKKLDEILINSVENMSICGSKNKNSIKLYKYFNNEKEFIIVMELCNENLMGFLKRKKKELNENELFYILIQLNNTFKIMSEKKIVHRNLKLENILVNYENSKYIFKIGDYGVSIIVDSFSKRKSSIEDTFDGTAPEILKGEKYDYKCDLWSLGIIIYILYFKLYLYDEDTCKNLLLKMKIGGSRELKKSGNKDLDNLLSGLLSKDPKSRITWEEYLNHPFFKNKQEYYEKLTKENNKINKNQKNEENKKLIDKDKFNIEDVDVKKYEKNYSEDGLWNKIKKYSTKIGAKPIYLILLLYYYLPKASFVDKAIIVGSLGFLISPLDLLLDTIPIIGFADDIALLLYVYHRVSSHIDNDIKNKAKTKFKSLFENYNDEQIEKLID